MLRRHQLGSVHPRAAVETGPHRSSRRLSGRSWGWPSEPSAPGQQAGAVCSSSPAWPGDAKAGVTPEPPLGLLQAARSW